MKWLPEPQPKLLMSLTRRFGIRRTAFGYAVYDYAKGKRISVHRSLGGALYRKDLEKTKLRKLKLQQNGE